MTTPTKPKRTYHTIPRPFIESKDELVAHYLVEVLLDGVLDARFDVTLAINKGSLLFLAQRATRNKSRRAIDGLALAKTRSRG